MKEIKIEVPQGYEIDKEKSTFEKIVFKDVNKKIEWEDFGPVEGFYIDAYCEIHDLYEGSALTNKNTFPTREEAEACLALSQLCQWRDKYNEGWKPDWSSFSEKYTIFYVGDVIYKNFGRHLSNVLAFKTEEIRDKFLEDFRELIQIAKPLL